MIYINGNWENINDLHDVVRIINEYNHEFASIIEELIPSRLSKNSTSFLLQGTLGTLLSAQ